MRVIWKASLASGMGVGLLLLLCVVRTHSQAAELTLVPPGLRPTNGLFYSFQNPDHPPLPQNIFPELPLYWVEEDSFLMDDETVDYEMLKPLWTPGFSLSSAGQSTSAMSSSVCGELTVPVVTTTWSFWTNVWTNTYLMTTVIETNVVTNVFYDVAFSVQNVPANTEVDIFGTFYWHAMTNPPGSLWYYLGRATNGQQFIVPNSACPEGWYLAACTNDSDGDGLGDAYELLVSKTSPDTNHSVSAIFDDGEIDNVLVNGLWQDWGNEQNTQFETTCVAFGTNIIVAWVDSNQGVYNLGSDQDLANYVPQMVAYAVSRNGGRTFEDMGVPPMSLQGTGANDNGDAGDPVLTVDRDSGDVYLIGTSPRNDGHKGVPVWKSTDGGVTFGEATNVMNDVTNTDKPWIAVDDWPGTNQHDVYVVSSSGFWNGTGAAWLTVSSNGFMNNWSEPIPLRQGVGLQGVIPLVGPDHVVYSFWLERDGANFFIKVRQVLNRGTSTGEIYTACSLVTTGLPNGNLELKRSNTSTNIDDTFKVPTLPVPALNSNTNRLGHLYVAFADRGTDLNDRADVFLTCSTNGGTTWNIPRRVNTDLTTNDQWMPVLAVKPDGTQLFMGWYDRRADTNNALIEVYGCFGAIAVNGDITFGDEFRISTASFPIAFAGTRGEAEPIHKQPGHYDPVYPPGEVNLTWWYPEWPLTGPDSLTPQTGPFGGIARHVGEYNGVFAEEGFVCFVWTDYRLAAVGSLVAREQSDIRFVRLSWP